MYIYMYVYIHVYIHVCVYVCRCAFTYMYIYIYICIYIYKYTHIYAHCNTVCYNITSYLVIWYGIYTCIIYMYVHVHMLLPLVVVVVVVVAVVVVVLSLLLLLLLLWLSLLVLYIYIYICTNTPQCPAPKTPSSLVVLLFHCAGGSPSAGAHTSGSYVGFFLAWALGDIKWQSARAARGPISGPSHPHPDSGFIPDLGQSVCAARVPIAGLVACSHGTKTEDPQCELESQLKALPEKMEASSEERAVAGSPSPWRQDTHACVITHNHQPRVPNQASGLGGWEKLIDGWGLWDACPCTWTNQWLQVSGIRIVCVCKLCTPPAIKHDISRQTRHNAQLPKPLLLLSFFFFTARGAHPARGLTRPVHTSGSSWHGPLEISSGKVRVQHGTRSRVPLIPL